MVLACVVAVIGLSMATTTRARGQDVPMKRLTPSYVPPAGDPLGDRIRDRAWTYDSSLTVIARALSGDLDGAGSVLDFYQ